MVLFSGAKKEDENAETGIVPGIDLVIGTGIETGIGIGIEIGIGIGIVIIVEDHVLDQEIVMDIADVISIARGQGTVVVPAPKTEGKNYFWTFVLALGGLRNVMTRDVNKTS